MESVLAAAITGFLTLVGVLVSNSRSKAVIECKLDELSARVEKHNQVLDRLYSVETKVAVLENDVAMCQTQYPDVLSEFSWGDNGAYGNVRGDQSGCEASVHGYYEYPWWGIIHFVGGEPVRAG